MLDASEQQLALVARGPFRLVCRYLLRPAHGGSEVDAAVSIEGHGLFGRLLAKATEALLAAGALRSSLERLGRALEPALTA